MSRWSDFIEGKEVMGIPSGCFLPPLRPEVYYYFWLSERRRNQHIRAMDYGAMSE